MALTPERKAYLAVWRKANKDRLKAYHAEWRQANPDKVKATKSTDKAKALDKANRARPEKKAKIMARVRRWQKANPEKVNAWGKRWKEANPEKVQAQRAAYQPLWYEKNKDWAVKHRAANRTYYRLLSQARRFRKRDGAELIPPDFVEMLLEEQSGKCLYCLKALTASYHIDHYMPLIRGGKHAPGNLQLLCPKCNRSKGGRDPMAFAEKTFRAVLASRENQRLQGI